MRPPPWTVLVSACVLIVSSCARTENDVRRNLSREHEDAIKLQWARRTEVGEGRTRFKSVRAVLTSRDEPRIADVVNLDALPDGSLLLVDNLHGELLRADVSRMSPSVESWGTTAGHLRYPLAVRCVKGSVYVWDARGITILDDLGSIRRVQRTFFGAHDFLVLDSGLCVNPSARADDTPLLLELRPDMQVAGRWPRTLDGPHSHVRARAYLALLGQRPIAGYVHRRAIAIFEDRAASTVDLSFPGVDDLADLEQRPELVSPAPGVVRLPTYVAGVAAAGGRAYVLLDLPQLVVLRIGLSGRVEATYLGGSLDAGRHYSRLAVAASPTTVTLFAIGYDPDRTRVVMAMDIDAPDEESSP